MYFFILFMTGTTPRISPPSPIHTLPPPARGAARRERRQRAPQALALLAQLVVAVAAAALELEPRGDDVGIERLRLSHPKPVDRDVANDREQPGQDRAAAGVIAPRVAPRADERLLGDVLGLAAVADDRLCETVRASLKAAHELRRGLAVPGCKPGQKRLVRAAHTRDYCTDTADGLAALTLPQGQAVRWTEEVLVTARSARTSTLEPVEQLLTIGVFARRSRLSPKALRLYERLGRLTPAYVDKENGYRRYREGQLETARLIVMLRRLDMPLATVAEIVDAPRRAASSSRCVLGMVERRRASQRELVAHLRIRLSGAEGSYDMYEIHERESPSSSC